MPRLNSNIKDIEAAGWGHPGFCTLCSLRDPVIQHGLDERIRAGWTYRQLQDWLAKETSAKQPSKTLLAKHKPHALSPRDRMVQSAQRGMARNARAPSNVSSAEFLQTIKDIGYRRAVERPEEVTIPMALKAVEVEARTKESKEGIKTLIAIFTDTSAFQKPAVPALPDGIVEGEAVEVP